MDHQTQFEKFDAANPHVWRLFKRFAFLAIVRGRKQLSASLITERIRWELTLQTKGGEFKINNNFRAFYARKFHREFPRHDGIFKTRLSVADFTPTSA